MYKATVHFETVVEAKAFVTASNEVDFKVELVSGPYIIDAKSIMGIFSLDLSKPIDLNIHAESNIDEILSTLSPYIIDEQ